MQQCLCRVCACACACVCVCTVHTVFCLIGHGTQACTYKVWCAHDFEISLVVHVMHVSCYAVCPVTPCCAHITVGGRKQCRVSGFALTAGLK